MATVADAALLDVIPLSTTDRELLTTVDLVEVVPPEMADPGTIREVILPDEGGDITVTTTTITSGWRYWPYAMLVSPERPVALGLDVVETGVLLVNPTDLTAAQQRELAVLVWGEEGPTRAFVEPGDDVGTGDSFKSPSASGLSVQTASTPSVAPSALVNGTIIATAVLLTLLVVAIGLALSATESRDERDVLFAVGAPPRTLSRLAGGKAVVLAATGVVLAIRTGYLPMWVLFSTLSDDPVPQPWLTIVLIVVAVPTAAGLAAWATSAVARRAHPVTMAQAFAD